MTRRPATLRRLSLACAVAMLLSGCVVGVGIGITNSPSLPSEPRTAP